jgi:hypothetical protein
MGNKMSGLNNGGGDGRFLVAVDGTLLASVVLLGAGHSPGDVLRGCVRFHPPVSMNEPEATNTPVAINTPGSMNSPSGPEREERPQAAVACGEDMGNGLGSERLAAERGGGLSGGNRSKGIGNGFDNESLVAGRGSDSGCERLVVEKGAGLGGENLIAGKGADLIGDYLIDGRGGGMGCEKRILMLELQEEMRIVGNNISAEGRREGGQSAGGHTCERANASALGQSQGEIIISETVHSREDIAAGPVVRATFELMLPRHMLPTLETPALSLR